MNSSFGQPPKTLLSWVCLTPQPPHLQVPACFEMTRHLVKFEKRPQESHMTSLPKAGRVENRAGRCKTASS
jgi:hypothetical protein